MKRLIKFTLFFFSIFNCVGQNKKTNGQFFDSNNFGNDTLYIKSTFMECGEWGGHFEISKVYLRGKDFYINYQKFEADCKSVSDSNLLPNQKLVKNVTKKLLYKDKMEIRLYMHELLNAKFREPIGLNFGYVFELSKSDNTILISVYTFGATIKNQNLNLIKKLFE